MRAAGALTEVRDLRELSETVLAMCRPFGPVRSCECVRFVGDRDERIVLCFIEPECETQCAALAHGLGAQPFGSLVCLKISLPP